uniref:Uncharacterized protein n=1 Tax=Candidatus Kentrum sp. DK TaxID=2126562 RepID=A0A450SVN5_9GAMM|nr:MAG: hypothetical protein BECKDK2373B_GA0170837_10703 [Candidatus Kentron sp. DK]VFJ63272.1 MAG: hypothetical protein BECKDK2373C_GA0170839_110513 [Candidatus Kentron sp. DK]
MYCVHGTNPMTFQDDSHGFHLMGDFKIFVGRSKDSRHLGTTLLVRNTVGFIFKCFRIQ